MPHTPTVTPQHLPIQIPGGGALRVLEDPEEGDSSAQGGGTAAGTTLALRYDTPSLGALDLRFELDPGGLRVAVTASPGQPLELAQAAAQTLQAALEQTGDRAATVTVLPRREHFDLYA
jgi:hypothetical protein